MGKPRYKLSDIADKAGVSTATVSRVLNGNTRISEKTANKVRKIAEELNYAPDLRFRWMTQNRGKPSAKTGNIGVVVDVPCVEQDSSNPTEAFTTDPYYVRMFWHIEKELSRLDHHLLLSTLAHTEDNYLPQMVKDLKVDGILYAGYDKNLVERISKVLPVVLLNSPIEIPYVPAFMPDEASGIRQAMDYLRELGHRKIYFFNIDDHSEVNVHHYIRRHAFKEYILEHSMSEAKLYFVESEKSSQETTHDFLVKWRQEDSMPTAIVCAADVHALSFLTAAETLGIDVPGQLSVIGADNVQLCEHSRPRLTSINQPFEEMGTLAARKIIEIINEPSDAKQPLFEVTLVKRESCAKAPKT